MANYLLDTNHISPLVTPGHPLRKLIVRHRRIGDTFGIAVPSLAEVIFGIQTLPRAEQNLREWARYEEMFDYYDIDKSDALDAADLQTKLRKQGWQLDTVDALIASIALRYDLTLLTTDNDFSAIVELPQENWLAS